MSATPSWLPPMAETDGVWEEVVARLYAVFQLDFKQGRPTFEGRPVWWDRRILSGDIYEEGFWHLITRTNRQTGDRIPEFPRAKRLPWCAPCVRTSPTPELKVWDYLEGNGRTRTYVWLKDWEYVVVLEKQTRRQAGRSLPIALLITAYHVDGPASRRRLTRKYEQRIPS